MMSFKLILRVGLVALLLLVAGPTLAYVGPGAGLGMMGSLIAVVVALVLGIVGIIVLPLRMMRNKFKSKSEAEAETKDAGSEPDGKES